MCTSLCTGLQDFSPEEIRLEAYMANAKGTADIYVRTKLFCIALSELCLSWITLGPERSV